MPQDTLIIKTKIGSSNGLVPSGNKPLPETVLVQIYTTIHGLTKSQWTEEMYFGVIDKKRYYWHLVIKSGAGWFSDNYQMWLHGNK